MSIEAMKQALAALEEPREHIYKHRRLEAITSLQKAIADAEKQRQCVGLTDEEMYLAIRPLYRTDETAQTALNISKDEYRAIEAKLKEKNT